jgi:hypothetical protein
VLAKLIAEPLVAQRPPDVVLGDMIRLCRGFALVRVALCRCDPNDQLPNREQNLEWNLRALRQGPPWPTLDAMDRTV